MRLASRPLTIADRIRRFPWEMLFLLGLVAAMGVALLYSIADQQWHPWAQAHGLRFGIAAAACLIVAFVPLRWFLALAYPFYGVVLILLVAVEFVGVVGMGAQRWLEIGGVRLQPAELMKLAIILGLARFCYGATRQEMNSLAILVPALLIIAAPVLLILRQPDLGTSLLVLVQGATVLLVAGAPLLLYAGAIILVLVAAPLIWYHGLHAYQKQRILTFLDPDRDPLGAGYHITQSKIAFGAGGITGQGFGEGSQSQLDFLPEKHTDFIFSVLGEEFGLLGTLGLLFIMGLIILIGLLRASACQHQFGRLVMAGVMTMYFLYIAINIGMVTGLLPVVGVPLPLVSYGGTAMLTLMVGFGMVAAMSINHDQSLPRGYR